jgi:hypothetical protein
MAVRRRPVVVEFSDQFGETQVIHRKSGGALAIRRKSPTVVLALSKVVGRHIGERVREERLKAGFTMEMLAERSGLKGGKQSIFRIESALDTGVRIGTLYALATALSVSPFSLMPPVDVALSESGVALGERESLAV